MNRFVAIAFTMALLIYGSTYLTKGRANGPWLGVSKAAASATAAVRPEKLALQLANRD